MKRLTFVMAVFCLTAGLMAQHDHAHKAPVHEDGAYTYHKDGSYSFKSVDLDGNDVTVVVEPRMPIIPDPPEADPSHPDYVLETQEMDDLRMAKPGGGGSGKVTVDVYVFVDEEYRAAYSNWQSKVGGIIEKADNAYGRDQNIDWNIVSYHEWTSNGRSASQILSDLNGDSSFVGPGLAMGFTADPNFEAGGIAYVYSNNPGTGVSVCVDQGNNWTAYALRHEIGHNYGCYHDFDPVVCLMNYTYAYSVDYFDASHESLINSHRNWFQ